VEAQRNLQHATTESNVMLTPLFKSAATDAPIEELIAGRWSPRAFDANRRVEPEKLSSLFEAARWAPSCFNEQPWRYLVFDGSNPDARQKAEDCLVDGNAWAKQAPVLLIGVVRGTFTHNDKPNRHAAHDLGAASLALALQAAALGLVVHQMGGFKPDAARSYFSIPEGFEPLTMIAVGYPGDVDLLAPNQKAGETGPRSRKPQREFVFFASWQAQPDERTA
jgi:nitroreductase